jgi:protein-serine/threonine kinase
VISQQGRFASPPDDGQEERFAETNTDLYGYDASTIRQKRFGGSGTGPLTISTGRNANLSGLYTGDVPSTYHPEQTQEPQAATIVAIPTIPMPMPEIRHFGNKTSLDTFASAPTSRSQPEPPRRDGGTAGRKPGGSMGEGLRGFQFPLVGRPDAPGPGASGLAITNAVPPRPVPPALHRMHSAAPAQSLPSLDTQPLRPPAPPFAARPQMMRQASVAVMEGRSQAQAQALAIAQAQVDVVGGGSPSRSNVALGLGGPPRPGFAMGNGLGMMRSRSGSRVEAEAGLGLRDLIKVCTSATLADADVLTAISCDT